MLRSLIAICVAALLPANALGHGDVAPQPVNTDALPEVGEEWLEENPYRAEAAGEEVWNAAVEIGASGYNQNCARCHGLEANIDGDEWYVERFIHGYTQNGTTKMPAFGELLGQKAAWAIRTYVETRPDDGALDDYADVLKGIRDDLKAKSEAMSSGSDYASVSGDVDAHIATLTEMVGSIATASGAPVADSAVSRALGDLDGTAGGISAAVDSLTIGLSAAQ